MTDPKYSLLTLKKGLAVLEIVAESAGELGLTEISQQLQEPVTVVFRILKTLSSLGYVIHDPRTKRYRLSIKVWELSEKAIARLDIVQGAQPVLARLTQTTAETSSLAILDGKDFLYLASVSGLQPLRAYVPPGSRTPLTIPTATGRVFLAYSSTEFIDEVLCDGLKPFTPATITDVTSVRAILQDIRKAGIAIVHGEYQPQLSAIAVPIFNSFGQCVASLSLSGLTQRFENEALLTLTQVIKAEAENLSNWLQGMASSMQDDRPLAVGETF